MEAAMIPAASDVKLMARRLMGEHGYRRARRIAADEARLAVGGPGRGRWQEILAEIERRGCLPIYGL